MRFIVHFEFNPEDTDKVLEDWAKNTKMNEENPGYTPKSVYPAQFTGNGTGFFIVEVSDPEQWSRGYLSGFPYVKWTPIACYDLSNWIETY
jgi:hypothetical protein